MGESTGKPLLNVSGLTVRFGGLTALHDIDLQVYPGQVLSVIGPNGAGKTTLFNAISGIYQPSAGKVELAGRPLRRQMTRRLWLAWLLAGLALGMAWVLVGANLDRLWVIAIKQHYTPRSGFAWQESLADVQGYFRGEPRVERHLSRWHVVSHDGRTFYGAWRDEAAARQRLAGIREQALDRAAGFRRLHGIMFAMGLCLGTTAGWGVWRQTRRTPGWIARQGIARTFQNNRVFKSMTVRENLWTAQDRRLGWRRDQHLARAEVETLLQFVGLSEQGDRQAAELAYGDQRRLEIARALATHPKLLLLDEPAAGMNPTETRALLPLVTAIAARGIAVLLIEHDINLVMAASQTVVVLEHGAKIAEGTPQAIRADPAVIAAYLGHHDA